jgi:rare lipoprotein A
MLCAFFFCAAASPALAKGEAKSTPTKESTRHVAQKHHLTHRSGAAHKSARVEESRRHGHPHRFSLAAAHQHRAHDHGGVHDRGRLHARLHLRDLAHAVRTHDTKTRDLTADHAIEHQTHDRQVGEASWYGREHVGRRTATGERFDPEQLTAAHPTLPLNTTVRVKNLINGLVVLVRINDRSAQSGHRIIDLSPRAADALDMKRAGVAPVVVERVSSTSELASAR